MKIEIAIWIMAFSLFLLALCALTYVILRVSDEMRFRRALDGIEHQENGAIVLSRRQIGRAKGSRNSNYRRVRAKEWLDAQMGGVKK